MSVNGSPVFLHSMWRTGSTYLASRFAAEARYCVFYEPFHEYVGSDKTRLKVREEYARARALLRHPEVAGGLFDIYDRSEPLTKEPLWCAYDPRSAIRDVYGRMSAKSQEYLRACLRVAEQDRRIAVFGFCRSGTQLTEMCRLFAGRHLYLYRNPIEQFRSYDWPANDYFVPTTYLQLACSRRWRRVLKLACDDHSALSVSACALSCNILDAMWSQRMARMLLRNLSAQDAFAISYLSWRVCLAAASEQGLELFSLNDLIAQRQLRNRLEGEFATRFEGLRSTAVRDFEADAQCYAERAARVADAVDRELMSSQYERPLGRNAAATLVRTVGDWPHRTVENHPRQTDCILT